MEQRFAELLEVMRGELDRLPAAMRQEAVSRQVILFLLHRAVKEMGLLAVPAWKPPRSTRDRIDLVGVEPGSDPPRVEVAFCVSPLVELAGIKALEWVECEHKVVVTFSRRRDKVDQSRFFLTPELEHWNLYD